MCTFRKICVQICEAYTVTVKQWGNDDCSVGTRALPMYTLRALVLSSLGGPRTARLGQTWLRPWSGLSQQTKLSLSCLVFNKHTVHKCLCNNYIQLIRSSEIKIEHSSVRVKIAKGLFSLPCYTFLESRKALMLINRDVLVVFNNVYLNLLLCPVQKRTISQMKRWPWALMGEPSDYSGRHQGTTRRWHFHLPKAKRTIKRHIAITWTGWRVSAYGFWQNQSTA